MSDGFYVVDAAEERLAGFGSLEYQGTVLSKKRTRSRKKLKRQRDKRKRLYGYMRF